MFPLSKTEIYQSQYNATDAQLICNKAAVFYFYFIENIAEDSDSMRGAKCKASYDQNS